MNDKTLCLGSKCTERETCKRFIEGKTRQFGWWFEGKKGNDKYAKCELFVLA